MNKTDKIKALHFTPAISSHDTMHIGQKEKEARTPLNSCVNPLPPAEPSCVLTALSSSYLGRKPPYDSKGSGQRG